LSSKGGNVVFLRILEISTAQHSERCGRVVNTLVSYSGGPGFKFRPGGQLFLDFRGFFQVRPDKPGAEPQIIP
jgi:hypothetical protein